MCGKKLLYMRNIKKGDIYVVSLEDKYNHVQNGVRPCLVVQNNMGNAFSPNLIVVPLTTKVKKTYMPVHVILEPSVMALCECIMTISKEQVIYYIKTLSPKTMKEIDDALSISLEIQKEERISKR